MGWCTTSFSAFVLNMLLLGKHVWFWSWRHFRNNLKHFITVGTFQKVGLCLSHCKVHIKYYTCKYYQNNQNITYYAIYFDCWNREGSNIPKKRPGFLGPRQAIVIILHQIRAKYKIHDGIKYLNSHEITPVINLTSYKQGSVRMLGEAKVPFSNSKGLGRCRSRNKWWHRK